MYTFISTAPNLFSVYHKVLFSLALSPPGRSVAASIECAEEIDQEEERYVRGAARRRDINRSPLKQAKSRISRAI